MNTLLIIDCLTVLANGTSDSLSGGAGWAGAGLLGAVLAWLLLVNIPAKDKQLKEAIDTANARHDTVITNIIALHSADAKEKREDFKDALTKVTDACHVESSSLHNILKRDLEESTSAVIDMRRVLEEMRDALVGRIGGTGRETQQVFHPPDKPSKAR